MKYIIAILITVLMITPYALAAGEDANQQKLFANMKPIIVEGIQGRVSILQNSLSCVNSATKPEQMKPCEEKERQAMEALQQQQKAKWDQYRPQK